MKKSKILCFAMAAVLALSVGALAACGKEEEPEDPTPTPSDDGHFVLPQYSDRVTGSNAPAVHDPSVFHDPVSGKYYAFGSHYAVAESEDLIVWEQKIRDNQHSQLFTGGVKAAMPQTVMLANNQTDAWAPDVEYYNGKYYMYISFTTGFGSNGSVISRVESDNVLGPYSNETIIVESINASGSRPNCIDPELFYDKDGGLWMVYGSFFGGVYIKELYNEGANWGLPKEAGVNNWGKLIWRNGYSAGVEGPFVFYNAETDYYYLMTSEDDLFTRYNMRIARSKTPDGPYVDITGADVAGAGKGNKVAGNYKFARAGSEMGYAALGHNSVVKDETGRYFVVCHVRRQTNSTATPTTGHYLYTFQLFFNEDGWPVMSPVAYEGEKLGTVPQAEAAGDYEVILHIEQSAQTQAMSVEYAFEADGTVLSGSEEVGTWAISNNYYVTIVLSGVTYKGVITPGWDMYSPKDDQGGVLAMTAISDTGRSLWALGK